MKIKCTTEENNITYDKIDDFSDGYIIPIGGGKDSVVTLEVLKVDRKKDYTLIINPKKTTLECAKIAEFDSNNIIEVYREIDSNLKVLKN